MDSAGLPRYLKRSYFCIFIIKALNVLNIGVSKAIGLKMSYIL